MVEKVKLQPRKLGMNASPLDQPRLMLSHYLDTSKLPVPPKQADWTHRGISYYGWGMLANDSTGCCVEAGQLHMAMAWIANATGQIVKPTSLDALNLYTIEGGYDPKNATATDNGTDPLTALQNWQQNGITITGTAKPHKIDAFAQVHPSLIKTATWLFGGLFVGWLLPNTFQGSNVWNLQSGPDAAPGSWGGHLAPLLAADGYSDRYWVITWGQEMPVTPGALNAYVAPGEIWAPISQEFLEINGKTPNGFALSALLAAAKLL